MRRLRAHRHRGDAVIGIIGVGRHRAVVGGGAAQRSLLRVIVIARHSAVGVGGRFRHVAVFVGRGHRCGLAVARHGHFRSVELDVLPQKIRFSATTLFLII